MIALYPSLAAANPLEWGTIISTCEPYCTGFHLDLMDNHLVPNLEGSVTLINAIAQKTSKQLWIHLMVENPLNLLNAMVVRPETLITFHPECTDNKNLILNKIKEMHSIASIAISPHTVLEEALEYHVDHFLVMGVNPGFCGQRLLDTTLDRLAQLALYKKKRNFTIGFDGGVRLDTINQLIDAGVDQLALGSALFNTADPADILKKLVRTN